MADTGRRLQVVADLDLEVGDDRGVTTARLTSTDGLVLDVVDPGVLLRCVPGLGLRGAGLTDLPDWLPLDQVSDLPVAVTSRGRRLGVVRLSPAGAVRFTPTVAGLPTIIRTATAYGTGRLGGRVVVGAVVAAVAAVFVVVAARRRR
ncbi:hypothetical protein V3N99_09630 [Dermatophilaceae bacterium Soc4.6]